MSDNLILDFPVLTEDSGDFSAEISYAVGAHQINKKLEITHTLKGLSFISRLVKNGDAAFSVLLFYRDSSDRQHYLCNTNDVSIDDEGLLAKQIIPMDFSYAPEITPSIVILKDKKISADTSSGLTDFWEKGSHFQIQKHSRIALAPKLKFTSGDVSRLMNVLLDENLNDGEMKVDVSLSAGEGETPVSLSCGKGVYDELHKIPEKITEAGPSNAVESMRSAIVTHALCAVYAYLQNLGEGYEERGVLLAHLEMLEKETDQNWNNQDFNPSLAATKMWPYAIKELYTEADDA